MIPFIPSGIMIPGIAIHTGTVRDGVSVTVSDTRTGIMGSPTDTPIGIILITTMDIMTGIIRIMEVLTGTDIMTDIIQITGITTITGRYITVPAGPLNRSVHQPPPDMPAIHACHPMSLAGEQPEVQARPVPVVPPCQMVPIVPTVRP